MSPREAAVPKKLQLAAYLRGIANKLERAEQFELALDDNFFWEVAPEAAVRFDQTPSEQDMQVSATSDSTDYFLKGFDANDDAMLPADLWKLGDLLRCHHLSSDGAAVRMVPYKNIQVIDGADNATYSIFRATIDEYTALFAKPGQDLLFADEIVDAEASKMLDAIWTRPVRKPVAAGIHGTIFFNMGRKKRFLPESRRYSDIDRSFVNSFEAALLDEVVAHGH